MKSSFSRKLFRFFNFSCLLTKISIGLDWLDGNYLWVVNFNKSFSLLFLYNRGQLKDQRFFVGNKFVNFLQTLSFKSGTKKLKMSQNKIKISQFTFWHLVLLEVLCNLIEETSTTTKCPESFRRLSIEELFLSF